MTKHNLHINVEAGSGQHRPQAIRNAVKLAIETNCTVSLQLNGGLYLIDPEEICETISLRGQPTSEKDD